MAVIRSEKFLAMIGRGRPAEREATSVCPGSAGKKQDEASGKMAGTVTAKSGKGGPLNTLPQSHYFRSGSGRIRPGVPGRCGEKLQFLPDVGPPLCCGK